MKYIIKQSPPASFTNYIQNNPNATYALFRKGKKRYQDTKQSLIEEQGYICCYCGRRIENDDSSQIEHFFAKGTPSYKPLQLDYETNLLACCDGGKRQRSLGAIRKEDLFCEAVKGNSIIPINPLTRECELKFCFDANGVALSVSKDAEVTINMLNLNSPVIKNMRKAAIKYYLDYPISDWQKEYDRLSQKDSQGKFEEFCFVLQNYIMMNHSVKTSI